MTLESSKACRDLICTRAMTEKKKLWFSSIKTILWYRCMRQHSGQLFFTVSSFANKFSFDFDDSCKSMSAAYVVCDSDGNSTVEADGAMIRSMEYVGPDTIDGILLRDYKESILWH